MCELAVTFLYPPVELSCSSGDDGFDVDASMANGRVDSSLREEHTS